MPRPRPWQAAALATALLALAGCTSHPSTSRSAPSPSIGITMSPSSAPSAPPPDVEPVLLRGHAAPINVLVWSPDGKLLASAAGGFGSKDFTVRLWRPNGAQAAVLGGHRCAVFSLAWSPDGRTLASGDCDGEVRLWHRNGTLEGRLQPHAGDVMALAWTPDSRLLATGSVASPTKNTVQLWDPATGSNVFTRHTRYSGGKFYNLGWSPDGRYLVGGATDYSEWRANGTLVFNTGECASCTPQWAFGWAPNGSMWAVGDESGDVSVYSTDGRLVGSGVKNSVGNVDVLAWSPDGGVLAAANELWRVEGQDVARLGGLGAGRVTAEAWSPDGALLAWAVTYSDEVRLGNPVGTSLGVLRAGSRDTLRVAWSPRGALLAAGGEDHIIRLWNLADWESKADLTG